MSDSETQVVPINFLLRGIATDQFAVFDQFYKESAEIQLGNEIVFNSNEEARVIIVAVRYVFAIEGNPFLVLQTSCHFQIEEESWLHAHIPEQGQFRIPRGFATHLAVVTVGTARGVLHAKTENTPFNKFLIPMQNLIEALPEDVILKSSPAPESAGTA